MKCSDLKPNMPVVCNVFDSSYSNKFPTDGSVVYVLPERKTVCVGWMDGYRYRTDDIPFEDMLAAYDPNGEYMRFDNIHGPSVLLTAD